ncbi:MAG TPA: cytochrome c [Gemmatimonadales bacterium]
MSRLLIPVLMLGLATGTSAQTRDSLPTGVTSAMVETGAQLYKGAGICFACHGADGKGTAGVGPNLADEEWLHSDGSYEAIVRQIIQGVLPTQSKSGMMMPPKGGSSLNDEQVRAVAAYVWTLSHWIADRRL